MKPNISVIQLRERKNSQSKLKHINLNNLSFNQKVALYTYSSAFQKSKPLLVSRSQDNLRRSRLDFSVSKIGITPSNLHSVEASPKHAKCIADNDFLDNSSQSGFNHHLQPGFGHPNRHSNISELLREDSTTVNDNENKSSVRSGAVKFPGYEKVLKPERRFTPVSKNIREMSAESNTNKASNKTTEMSFENGSPNRNSKTKLEKSFLNNLENLYFNELQSVKKETEKLLLQRKSPYIRPKNDLFKSPTSTKKHIRFPSQIFPTDGSFVLESLMTPYARKLPEIRTPQMQTKAAASKLRDMQMKAEVLRSVKKIEKIGHEKRDSRSLNIRQTNSSSQKNINRSLFSAESNLLSSSSFYPKFKYTDESRVFLRRATPELKELKQ